ncbi:MAG: hypothetical protein K2X91_10215 [Thermoleophilia bacterium]|nr:hypothetical protein [Thermoleophilia bacterium]
MARAAEDVAGSALHAPGVGSGPTAEPLADTRPAGDGFAGIDPALRRETGTVEGGLTVEVGTAAGIPPNLMSREGSFGAAEDRRRLEDFGPVVDAALFRTDADDRRNVIRDLAMVAFTGAKLAAPMPKTLEGVEALQDEGFDLVVVARQEGFRRAGVAHPAAETLRRSRDFSAAEIEALSAEPMLIVRALR